MAFNQIQAFFGQGSNGRWSRIELGNLVFFDHLPKTPKVRVRRHAFKHHRRRSIGQRAVDDIGMPRNPSNIRGTPVDIFFTVLEYVLKGVGGINHIACRGMQHPFGFTRRS